MDASLCSSGQSNHDVERQRLRLEEEIKHLSVSLSDLKTRRDTLPPMAHLFDPNVQIKLDNDIHSLEKILRDRKQHRNSLAGLAHLSDAILVHIIMYAREFPCVKYHGRTTPQLAIYTYVCQHWRALILESPILWTNVNLSWQYHWVETWLFRSQPAALDITMDMAVRQQYLSSLTNLVSANSFRLRRVRIAMAHFDDWIATLQNFIPLLELLELQVLQAHDSELVLPPFLLGGKTPPFFRVFGFHGPHSIWSSQNLSNLTSFTFDQYSHQCRPSNHLWEILRALQGMSRLEYLHLEGEAFPDDIENPDRLLVYLPSIKSVHFRGPIRRVAVMIDHLVMPPTVAIALQSTTIDGDIDGLNILLQYFSAHFHQTRITAECVRNFDRVTIQQYDTNTKIWVDGPDDVLPPFTFELPLSGVFEYIASLCYILPLAQAKTLCISGYHVPQDLWAVLLEKMLEVQVLDMGLFACLQFSYAIAGLRHLMPLLKADTIGLYCADFDLAMRRDGQFFDTLLDCLLYVRDRQRLRMKDSRLKTVEIYRCAGLDEGFVKKLRCAGFDVKVNEEDPAFPETWSAVSRRNSGIAI